MRPTQLTGSEPLARRTLGTPRSSARGSAQMSKSENQSGNDNACPPELLDGALDLRQDLDRYALVVQLVKLRDAVGPPTLLQLAGGFVAAGHVTGLGGFVQPSVDPAAPVVDVRVVLVEETNNSQQLDALADPHRLELAAIDVVAVRDPHQLLLLSVIGSLIQICLVIAAALSTASIAVFLLLLLGQVDLVLLLQLAVPASAWAAASASPAASASASPTATR